MLLLMPVTFLWASYLKYCREEGVESYEKEKTLKKIMMTWLKQNDIKAKHQMYKYIKEDLEQEDDCVEEKEVFAAVASTSFRRFLVSAF